MTWEEVAAFATLMTILFGLFYALMKKWFLDLETYNSDKKAMAEETEANTQKIVDGLKEALDKMQEDKANAEDLHKAEQRIEKIDSQIASIMTTIEKQCYRLDLLIETRGDVTELVKELKMDTTSQFKDLKNDIARQENKLVNMQLDIQDLKTRLGG